MQIQFKLSGLLAPTNVLSTIKTKEKSEFGSLGHLSIPIYQPIKDFLLLGADKIKK